MKSKILAIIPARGGSKRIPNKNIRIFNGKPLIYYAINHALKSKVFDRVIVDTDSPEIAKVALKYGAEVPFLRPAELATSETKINENIIFLLNRLKREHKYVPDIISLIQTTSPLRRPEDIRACYEIMSANQKIKSVCTVCDTSPWFFRLSTKGQLMLVNKDSISSTNTQEVPKGYILNGCMVYMVKTPVFLKTRKFVDFENGSTVGIVCDKWRSVDLDHPEDWVLAEFLHKHQDKIYEKIKRF